MSSPDLLPASPVAASLSHLCLWGRAIALAALALIAGWFAYLALHPDEILSEAMRGLPALEAPPGPAADAAAKLLLALPGLVFALALWWLWQMFGEIQAGRYLHARAQALLAQLGWMALGGSLISILTHTFAILLFTSNNPPGRKMLSIALSSTDISALIMGLLLFIFARLLREMAAVAEDNRSII